LQGFIDLFQKSASCTVDVTQGVFYQACLQLFANQLLNALYEFLIYSGIYKMLPH